MARIKKIEFYTADEKTGCLCDRCGQYIKNIWSVEYTDGLIIRYGIDCFAKVRNSSNLTAYGKKLMNKSLKSIQNYSEQLEQYKNGSMTAETDDSYKSCQMDYYKGSYWYGKPFEEYKDWMINECLPYRIEAAQKEFNEKFKKTNFKEI